MNLPLNQNRSPRVPRQPNNQERPTPQQQAAIDQLCEVLKHAPKLDVPGCAHGPLKCRRCVKADKKAAKAIAAMLWKFDPRSMAGEHVCTRSPISGKCRRCEKARQKREAYARRKAAQP